MSTNIDVSYQEEYSANLSVASQQQDSRLLKTVEIDKTAAEKKYFERLGAGDDPREKTGRFQDIEFDDLAHSRRIVIPRDFDKAYFIDKSDQLRMAIDPAGEYVRSQTMLFNRHIDKTIIAALTGVAVGYASKGVATNYSPLAGNTIAANYNEDGTTTVQNLTVGKIKKARQLLESAEVIQPGERLTLTLTSNQKMRLLADQQVTSMFYNDGRPLATGILENYLGCDFVQTELLPLATNVRTNLVYPMSAAKFTWLKPLEGVLTVRTDKKFHPIQMYASASYAAVRMWEERVVQILCDETK